MLRTVLFIASGCVFAAYLAPELTARFINGEPPRISSSRPVANVVTPPDVSSSYGGGHIQIPSDRSGHYFTEVHVNGRPLSVMIDTGASSVILRYEDARDLGLVYGSDPFEISVQTANGTATAHRVKLDSVRIGSISFDDIEALVMEQGVLQTNLLGMSFMKRLSRYEVRDGTLVLER